MLRRQDLPVVALIPLRNGSRGLKGKNTMLLHEKPLYQWTLDAALDAKIERVIISTNIPTVLGTKFPREVLLCERPERLCEDKSTMDEVLNHHVSEGRLADQNTVVVLLQATSPLRTATHITEAIEIFKSSELDLLMSVTEADNKAFKSGTITDGTFLPIRRNSDLFSNRQELPPLYRPNGAIYIFLSDRFKHNGSLSGLEIVPYEMEEIASLDVDTEEDFRQVEGIIAANGR